jgi:UDP-3-O-[3-hydroxymyristoyl] glucosamine N-acyltransferase
VPQPGGDVVITGEATLLRPVRVRRSGMTESSRRARAGTISPLAVVQTSTVGENVTIGEFAIVRAGASIGSNVVIHPTR